MRETKIALALIVLLFFLSALSPLVGSQDDTPFFWNTEWSYRQELQIPIRTNDSASKYQPIDIHILFENPCWTKNVNETSVRICSWDGTQWTELESQIYDIIQTENNFIKECNVIFLIPPKADGNERYYIFYDDTSKPIPTYPDHVSVRDEYFLYSPVADITASAYFYGIKEDGYCVYGVGQDGQLLDRGVAQVVVKQQKDTTTFNLFNADEIVSFGFSYYYGSKEKDESSSDQVFVSKKIFSDGNLMVEFGIISESKKKDVRTTAIYKYYYCPLEDKRIAVHVKHQMLADTTVQGIENVDGRFGSIIVLKSRSAAVDQMNFGQIYPFLNFFGKEDNIETYQMDENPSSKNREWIISYKDDADLGKEAWMSYGEGKEGKGFSVIFSSNTDLVKAGTDERDGIQLKVAEKEYFNFLGTEVDYASINFGRNSYETGSSHDLFIPSDLCVEFDAEVYTTDAGGYKAVEQEAQIFQTLVKYRQLSQDPLFEGQKKRYDLTVITHLGGTRFSYPVLANKTGRHFPVMWIELYRDGRFVTGSAADRFMFIRSIKTFSEIVEGTYLVKVFWKISNSTKIFSGAAEVTLNQNSRIQIWCTWERKITAVFLNQQTQGIEGIHVALLNNHGVLIDENITDSEGCVVLKAPYNRKDSYRLQAFYHEFSLYNETLRQSLRRLSLQVDVQLYDVTIDVKDLLGFPPGVDITPILSTTQNNKTIRLTPSEITAGQFTFKGLLSGEYSLQILYAEFIDERLIRIPDDGDVISIPFTAQFDLSISLFDARGNPVENQNTHFLIAREESTVKESDETTVSLPPGIYTIKVTQGNEQIGRKEVELTNDRQVIIVTSLSTLLPLLWIGIALIFMGCMACLFFLKKQSLPTFLKCIAFTCIIIGLMLPWWSLTGSSTSPQVQRTIVMYLYPRVMIETTTYAGSTSLDIAEMPDQFVDLLGVLFLLAIVAGLAFGASIFLKKLRKKQYAITFGFIGMLMLVFLLFSFYVGTSKLTETSIGSVQGAGLLPITMGATDVILQASWGFTSGFYFIIVSLIIAIVSFTLDILFIVKKKTRLLEPRN